MTQRRLQGQLVAARGNVLMIAAIREAMESTATK